MSEMFTEVVASYMGAADHLGLSKSQVEGAVRLAATRPDKEGQCPSCQFSRARKDVLEVARLEDRLPVYERRCIFSRMTGLNGCPQWGQLEVPTGEKEKCGLCEEEAAPNDWVCPGCRAHLNGLSPRTKNANRPAGGRQHGWLALRRASSSY